MQSSSRRKIAGAIGLAILGGPQRVFSSTPDSSSGPIEWVVGYPAGGGSDIIARVLAETMSKLMGRTFIVVNKPGAATGIAADYVAKARDRLVVMTADIATLAANPWLYKTLLYRVEDLEPIGLIARFPLLLVVQASLPVNSLQDLIAWAVANGQRANYASAGVGSPHHLAMELLKVRSSLRVQHVPYKGAAPALQDIAAGQVPCGFMDAAASQQFLAAGRIRAIGVANNVRLPDMPSVPTLVEQGAAEVEASAWQGLVASKAVTKPEAEALTKGLRMAIDSSDVRERLRALGVQPLTGTGDEMRAFATAERERWGRLIRGAGIEAAG